MPLFFVSFFCFMMIFVTGCGLTPKRSSRFGARLNPEVKNVDYMARRSAFGVRKRILVLPFLNSDPKSSLKVKSVTRKTVVRELIRTGRFVVIHNQDFPKDLSQFITEENQYDLSAIAKIAQPLGVTAVIEGKILEIKSKRMGDAVGLFRKIRAKVSAKIKLRVASCKTGRIIWKDLRSATVEADTTRVAEYSFSDRFLEEDPKLIRTAVLSAFRGTLRGIVESIEKISWEGRVALVSGDRIYVNAGRLSGLQVGDLLKVSEKGQEVYDPDRGTFLGSVPGRMKGTLEVISYFGKDGSITIVHSGSGFKVNDSVELY